jgi:hypothetical protein
MIRVEKTIKKNQKIKTLAFHGKLTRMLLARRVIVLVQYCSGALFSALPNFHLTIGPPRRRVKAQRLQARGLLTQ